MSDTGGAAEDTYTAGSEVDPELQADAEEGDDGEPEQDQEGEQQEDTLQDDDDSSSTGKTCFGRRRCGCGWNMCTIGWITLLFLIIMILITTLVTRNAYAKTQAKDWVLVGGITAQATSFRIRTDASGSSARQLVVSTKTAEVVFSTNINYTDLVASITVDSLDSFTTYTYETLSESGSVVSSGSFRTAPTDQSNFRIAAAGCAWTGSKATVFQKIADTNPLLFVHLGDFHYEDLNTESVKTRVQAIDQVMQSSTQQSLYSRTGLVYMWDDHDYLGNDSGGEGVGRDAALESYRVAFPFYAPLPASEDTTAESEVAPYHAFTIGTVRFIVSDVRSESSSETIYSDAQRQWLFNEISNSESYDFVIWITSKPWIGPVERGDDAWWGHPEDRSELSEWIVQNTPKGNLLALSADAHMVGFDDGRNTYYGSNSSVTSSFPILQTGPLDRLGSAKGGPYSDGCRAVDLERNHQFSTIDFNFEGTEPCLEINAYDTQGGAVFSKRLCGNIFGSTDQAGGGSCDISKVSGGSIAAISAAGLFLVLAIVMSCWKFRPLTKACAISFILIISFLVVLVAGLGIPFAMGVGQYDTSLVLIISMIQMLVLSIYVVVWPRRQEEQIPVQPSSDKDEEESQIQPSSDKEEEES